VVPLKGKNQGSRQ